MKNKFKLKIIIKEYRRLITSNIQSEMCNIIYSILKLKVKIGEFDCLQMKKSFFIFIVPLTTCLCQNLFSQTDIFINGYFKKNGTYVQPHFKTAPNSSMFDNYSTKGNYNPYTGKPGWIDPYEKLSSTYLFSIPKIDRYNYDKLVIYLNNKDAKKYFKILDHFDFEYNLFFTALFKMNNNEIKEANKIFDNLRRNINYSEFVIQESNYWFDITSKYLDADQELENIISSIKKYETSGEYEVIINDLKNIKNPLNYHYKYLVKFSLEYRNHKYKDAKESLDSLMIYTSDKDLKEKLLIDYSTTVLYLSNLQKTIETQNSGTYFYKIEDLIDCLKYFINYKEVPLFKIYKGQFEPFYERTTKEEFIFKRSLYDTSRINYKNFKLDYLTFNIQVSELYGDTIGIIIMEFYDDLSYSFYESQLSQYKKKHNIKSKATFKFYDAKENIEGFEYLTTDTVITGLVAEKADGQISKLFASKFRLYLYAVQGKGGNLKNLSILFD